jgi:hypothetical protein
MDRAKANDLEPIEGETFHDSRLGLFGFLFGYILLGVVGLLLLWAAWWTDFFAGNQFVDRIHVAIIGGLLLLAGIILTPYSLLNLLRPGRLIVGTDRLQRVVGSRRVVTQIPFHNIAKVELVEDARKGKYIGINLADPNDPETWNPDAEFYKKWKICSWDYEISTAAQPLPLEQIYERLRKSAPAV